jgi:sialidase-1
MKYKFSVLIGSFVFLSFCMQAQPLAYTGYFTSRGGLGQSYTAITKEKKATVAFLGGSITYNPGWRDLVCDYLKKQYPLTEFRFIAAGIPSLGSLPHAFRIQRDLLDSGMIDLLFVEAAVNDRVNGTDSVTQVRALEGIVRHARHSNPAMDIIMMAFADPAKTRDYDSGKIPVEVANQELVAGHYHLPSINVAKEVRDKMNHGEFSWIKDFKDIHPAPFGQELYFNNIKALLETCYGSYEGGGKPADAAATKSQTVLLPAPLDKANLENGQYYGIEHAIYSKDWTPDRDWKPADSAHTRPGFVHVPVLSAVRPGAALSLSFKGTAVGVSLLAGPDAGIISYSIDDLPSREIDCYTQWSGWLHLPWYLLFGSGLTDGPHVLHISISGDKNPASKGNACRIVHFLVNTTSGNVAPGFNKQ